LLEVGNKGKNVIGLEKGGMGRKEVWHSRAWIARAKNWSMGWSCEGSGKFFWVVAGSTVMPEGIEWLCRFST